MTSWLALVTRDLRLAWRQRGDLFIAVSFFLLVAALFPFALGPEPNLLLRIGPGVVWVAALLASLLGLARLFAADHADGTLEQMVLAHVPGTEETIHYHGELVATWAAATSAVRRTDPGGRWPRPYDSPATVL